MSLKDPTEMLGIPALPGVPPLDQPPHPSDRFSPPPLSGEEQAEIEQAFAQVQQRLRHLQPVQVSVAVDGREQVRFEPHHGPCEAFTVPASTAWVQVYGHDQGESLLLAAFPLPMLTSGATADAQRFELRHARGQTVTLDLQPLLTPTGELDAYRLQVTYTEAPQPVAVWTRARQYCWAGYQAWRALQPRPWPVVAGLAGVSLVVLGLAFWLHKSPLWGDQVASVYHPTPTVTRTATSRVDTLFKAGDAAAQAGDEAQDQGDTRKANQKYEEARQWYRQVLDLPDQPRARVQAWKRLGQLYAAQQAWFDARHAYAKALALAKDLGEHQEATILAHTIETLPSAQ
jgi:hypothetical protein